MSTIVSGDGERDLKLEALDLLQCGVDCRISRQENIEEGGRWCFCRTLCPEAFTHALTRLPHGKVILPPPTLRFTFSFDA